MNRFAMGNESSQLERSGAGPQRAVRTIGPSMSPTPEPEDRKSTQTHDPAASPHNLDAEPIPDELPSKKKKRKKHRKGLDSDAAASELATTGQEDVEPQNPKKKSKKKKSKRKELEPEAGEVDEAVIEDTQLEPELADTEQPPSPLKRKKKKSKKHGSRADELPILNGLQQEDLLNGDRFPEPLLKNGTQVEDASPSSEPQQGFVDHVDGGTPPSAQPPRFNHEPSQEVDEDEEDRAVIPSSQWQPSRRESTQSLDPSQLKSEVSESEDDDQSLDPGQLKKERSESQAEIDEYLQSQFAGIAAANFAEAVADPEAEAMRGRDPENGLGWLHKRENAPQETPITDTRTAHQRSVDASLPDLQPSQVKTEPDAGSDSASNSDKSTESASISKPDSDSPSAQRSERLSRSRSRSASRAPAGSSYLADQAVSQEPWRMILRKKALTKCYSSEFPKTLDLNPTPKYPIVPLPAQVPIEASRLASPVHPARAPVEASQLVFPVLLIQVSITAVQLALDLKSVCLHRTLVHLQG